MSSLGTRPRRVARCHSVRYGSGVLIPASPSSPAVCPRLWYHPYPSSPVDTGLPSCSSAEPLPPIRASSRLNSTTSRPLLPPAPAQITRMAPTVASKFSVIPWLRPPPTPHPLLTVWRSSLLASVHRPVELTLDRDVLLRPMHGIYNLGL